MCLLAWSCCSPIASAAVQPVALTLQFADVDANPFKIADRISQGRIGKVPPATDLRSQRRRTQDFFVGLGYGRAGGEVADTQARREQDFAVAVIDGRVEIGVIKLTRVQGFAA
ncbi:hypothetical protein C8K44_10116 [Aminobacter sp. AP02]|nr:hypothetical protein C8K44_10116 [Aminobacter sp. AP02]